MVDSDSKYNLKTHEENLIKRMNGREINGNKRNDQHIFSYNRNCALHQRDLKGNTGCVNAVEFSPDENWIVSG